MEEQQYIGRVVLEHDGEKFAYDFDSDAFGYERYLQAFEIWRFQQMVAAQKPESFADLEATGATKADRRAFAWLLIEVDEEGRDMPFDEDSIVRATAFLQSLPGRHAPQLEEVKNDFFGRAGLYRLDTLMQLGGLNDRSIGGTGAEHVSMRALMRQIGQQQQLSESTTELPYSEPEGSTDDSIDEIDRAPDTTGASAS